MPGRPAPDTRPYRPPPRNSSQARDPQEPNPYPRIVESTTSTFEASGRIANSTAAPSDVPSRTPSLERWKAPSAYRPPSASPDPRASSARSRSVVDYPSPASPSSSEAVRNSPKSYISPTRSIYRPPAPLGAASNSSVTLLPVEGASSVPTGVTTSTAPSESDDRPAAEPSFVTPSSATAAPRSESSKSQGLKIRCSKCGSKGHLWKECPDDRKCARCSDPDNTQACQTVVIRTRMMKECKDEGDLRQLRKLLSSLKSDGHKPTVHSYSMLLSLLISKGQMQEAQSVLKTMEEEGVVPDTICFNTILNGWCSLGRLEEAKAVLEQLKDRQYKLTTSTYNTLIKGFGLAGQAAEAMKLLQQMISDGVAKPNKVTYNILINAWAKVKNVEQARWVLNLMRTAGFSPDVVTYNTIAKAYAELRRSFEAERVLEEMQNAYIRPNERTYGIIINSYCETGRPEEGLALLDRMKIDGVRCNLPIYNILIKGFSELYQPENVDKVLRLMEASGVKPDVQSFSLVMNVWCSSGSVEEARAVLNQMQTVHKVRPDVTAYTILAKGYVRARRPAEAEGLLAEMRDQGLRPNVYTYTTVISGWCNVGNMDDAFRIFKDMQSRGVRPNPNTVNTLIWGFSEAKEPQRAEEVLEALKQVGIYPDRKCLELVAEAWRSLGLPAEARRVLRNEGFLNADSDRNSLKTRFDSMTVRREAGLDMNTQSKVSLDTEATEVRPSGRLPQIVINSLYSPMLAEGAARGQHRVRGSMSALAFLYRSKTCWLGPKSELQAFKARGQSIGIPVGMPPWTALALSVSQCQCRLMCRVVDQRRPASILAGAVPVRPSLLSVVIN
ncbi:hypothetical protein AXG93_4875s1160 [Marchantia polymorpha subsp. ruderalis]|nr:hypothetical protein AXG93_4875s1160 [Marchantia polymorpha subsp. ruderalis]